MARSLEERRFKAFMDDPERGAAFVRLRERRKTESSQEREILDLISANRGREARAKLAQYDLERIEKNRSRSAWIGLVGRHVDRVMTRPKPAVERYSPEELRKSLKHGTVEEFAEFLTFTREDVRSWAQIQNHHSSVTGEIHNPLWYHPY
jgi:hypothetical protein